LEPVSTITIGVKGWLSSVRMTDHDFIKLGWFSHASIEFFERATMRRSRHLQL